MSVTPKYHAEFTWGDTGETFQVTDSPNPARSITIPTGDYFIQGYSGEASRQLAEEIQFQVRAAGAEFASFVCVVSDGTGSLSGGGPVGPVFSEGGGSLGSDFGGRVVMYNPVVNGQFSLTWTSSQGAAMRDLLGFTGNLTAEYAHASPNQHQYGWYPNEPLREVDGDPYSAGMRKGNGVVTQAPSEKVTTTHFGSFTNRNFYHHFIEKHRALKGVPEAGQSVITNQSYEEFWEQAILGGKRWRWYPDRTTDIGEDGTSAPFEYKADQATFESGTEQMERTIDLVDLMYTFTIGAHKYA